MLSLPVLLPNSTWPCSSHSPLRSQPDSEYKKSLYMFFHHLVTRKWNKLFCDFVFNEIRNHVYLVCHYLPSMKTCMKWCETLRAENFLLCSQVLVQFSDAGFPLIFNFLLIQFPHFKNGDNNGAMSWNCN